MKTIITGIIFSVACISTQAQESFTNNGTLKIHAGAQISFNGNVVNKSGAAFVNDGQMFVKRNLTNDQSSMAAQTGTLSFNGNTVQTLNGNQPFSTYHLATNNTSGIQLNNDLQVSGTHQFLNGMVTTSAGYALVYKAGANYNGSTDSRHVHGWVRKEGSTNFVFPVGSATVLRPVSLSSLSGVGIFSARHLLSTPYAAQLLSPLVTLHRNEYWEIQKNSGGSARVDLNWDHTRIAFNNWTLPEITTASYNGSQWTDIGGTASGNVTGTGNISSDAVSSFQLFTFGSRSFPVPLTLLDFSAQRKNGVTAIEWITTNEQDVDHFAVERSDNGNSFFKIGTLRARNSGMEETYRMNDDKPVNRVAYYRLRSQDRDGSSTISRVIMVMDQKDKGQVNLVNNPVTDHIMLSVKDIRAGNYQYSIIAANGSTVQKGTMALHETQIISLGLAGFSKGSYIMILQKDGLNYQLKFMVH